MLKRALVPLLALVVSGALVVSFITSPVLDSVADMVKQSRPVLLLLAVAWVPILQWLRAWRFSLLLNPHACPPSAAMFKLAAHLSLLNMALPFKVGDFSFPLLARKIIGAELLKATGVILWCRVTDLGVVLAILLLCSAFLIKPEQAWYRGALSMLGLGFLVSPMVLTFAARLSRLWPALEHVSGTITAGSWLDPRRHALHLLLTIVIWLVHGWSGYLAARAISDALSYLATLLAAASSNLAFALPITGVAGLGPPQAAWAAALHLTGSSWDIAIATALAAYVCMMAGIMLTAGLTLFWPPPSAAATGLPALDRS